MRFMELGVVARGGIEPPTRGFSIQRRARFGATKAKTGKGFLPGRPNRPRRPSLFRTGNPKFRPNPRGPNPVQRLTRIATEPFPNRQLNWAALSSGSLALTTSRPAPQFTTLQSGRCTVKNDPQRKFTAPPYYSPRPRSAARRRLADVVPATCNCTGPPGPGLHVSASALRCRSFCGIGRGA